ncbi:ABC transporter ATP-binding protein [Spirulina sp. 06S082]|uniref:ABC transporter ATP-binding protein n=1 Tax=Spirulina sp. 06S082 TaxID=3110248 RepID=UPI002B21F5C7|nr:ATP-binding cassette domain-containing protein [Spirulina sp. 06S082]MEA5470779.1 ATP-binding cassette domain-containing protein [Spirulina sp. 06S082]
MENNIIVQTHNLRKTYRKLTAVENVNITVRKGDVFGFLGPNGAGKTTTIAMLLGLIHPTGGEVKILGQKVTPNHNKVLRHVGALVGATPALIPHLSARKNLQLMATLYPDLPKNRVQTVLELVGLADVARRKPEKFSTGMKQRLGMALAILHQPQLLILDEPTNGMDPAGMQEMRQIIQTLSKEGVTVFLSSHLLYEIEQVCNRIAVLNRGALIAEGTMAEMRGEEKNVRIKVKNLDAAFQVLETLDNVTYINKNNDSIDLRGIDSELAIKSLCDREIYPSEVFYTGNDLENLFLELTKQEEK